MKYLRFKSSLLVMALALVTACAPAADVEVEAAPEEIVLGPVDGHDLPPTDLERVTAGDLAPDFTAIALGGDAVTLSEFRGDKNVILFFYRGHW